MSIDSDANASQVLLIRGTVRTDTVEGVAPEYAAAVRRRVSEEDAKTHLEQAASVYPSMTRVFIRPDWVGILDFKTQTRLPSAVERAMERAQNV